jgi:archaeosine-15-forming tRNA-guanine transglycosylase
MQNAPKLAKKGKTIFLKHVLELNFATIKGSALYN